MKAKEIMSRDMKTVEPDASLTSAARLMKVHDVGILPVVTAEGRAVGTITDRDIALRAVAAGLDPDKSKVGDAMSDGIEFCYDDDHIEQVSREMGDKKVRRIVVVNRDSRGIRGIVSVGDIAMRADDKHAAGKILAQCVAS